MPCSAPLISAAEDDALGIDGDLLSERDLIDATGDDMIALPEGADQEWLLGELWKDLIRGEQAKAVLAESQMRRVIEVNRSLEHKFVDGLGQLRARVPLEVALHWTSRYGDDFWRQEDSLQYFAERNPGFLVETQHRKSIFRFDGGSDNQLPAATGAAAGLSARGQYGEKPAAGTGSPAAAPAPTGAGLRRRGRWAA